MAKYMVTYKCGHVAEVQLFGKMEDREKKIAWYATIDCPECQADKAKQNHLQKTEAKYWIDNRFDLNNIDTTEWLKEVVEA